MTDLLDKWSALDPALAQRRLNAGLGGGGGAWTKISGGTITTPVSFVEIALPPAYVQFKLIVTEMHVAGDADWVAGAFATDTKTYCDASHHDTYGELIFQMFPGQPNGSLTSDPVSDSLIDIGDSQHETFDATIFPGNSMQLVGIKDAIQTFIAASFAAEATANAELVAGSILDRAGVDGIFDAVPKNY